MNEKPKNVPSSLLSKTKSDLTECIVNWYGLDCKLQCSEHCKDKGVCNHVTGKCDGGCAAGWYGALCDEGKLNSSYFE